MPSAELIIQFCRRARKRGEDRRTAHGRRVEDILSEATEDQLAEEDRDHCRDR